jgi:tetratricopeptide (TPR) repeat protein
VRDWAYFNAVTPQWRKLINAQVAEIHVMARDPSLPSAVGLYARVLSAFLQGDLEGLENLRLEFGADAGEGERAAVRSLRELRLAIRRRGVDAKTLRAFAGARLDGVFEAEKLFCLGMAWEHAGRDDEAMASFARAAAIYKECECPRKALRAHYNCVVADSRLNPHKNFIADYQSVIELSRASGDREFEGMALAMLSREYQVIGWLERAFEMIEDSLRALESERGCIHYFHSVLQKAHVLIELGRRDEAAPLLRECELASFPAIAAARRLLELSLNPALVWDRRWEKDLLPTWRNRLPQLTKQRRLVDGKLALPSTALEERLLKLAYNGPIQKWDLIARLYPGEDSALILENRFKNLVARVRKKYPGLVNCEDGRYSVAKMPGVL